MRICDVCSSPAVGQVRFSNDEQEFDICETHKQALMAVLDGKPDEETRRRGRPKKDE